MICGTKKIIGEMPAGFQIASIPIKSLHSFAGNEQSFHRIFLPGNFQEAGD
jgi:hypothetical protein